MTSVTVSETKFNVTVSDTTDTVTVTSGDTINVSVNQQTLSTAVSNTGSGSEIGKAIVGDTLQLRKIKSSGNPIMLKHSLIVKCLSSSGCVSFVGALPTKAPI